MKRTLPACCLVAVMPVLAQGPLPDAVPTHPQVANLVVDLLDTPILMQPDGRTSWESEPFDTAPFTALALKFEENRPPGTTSHVLCNFEWKFAADQPSWFPVEGIPGDLQSHRVVFIPVSGTSARLVCWTRFNRQLDPVTLTDVCVLLRRE